MLFENAKHPGCSKKCGWANATDSGSSDGMIFEEVVHEASEKIS